MPAALRRRYVTQQPEGGKTMGKIAKGLLAASLTLAAGFAASHRNGPLLLEDQTANLNDFYIFRSYESGKSDRLVMSMSAQGFQNPDNGPSYYKFSPSVLYRFNINNSRGLDGNWKSIWISGLPSRPRESNL